LREIALALGDVSPPGVAGAQTLARQISHFADLIFGATAQALDRRRPV
jgi:hypothetical protein